jgi:MscS family membrane protein
VDQLRALLADPRVLAAAIALGAIAAAFLSQLLIRYTFLALARKTETDLDDQIVAALRQPIFLSVLFFGLVWAVEPLELPARALYVILGVLKTLAVLVWSTAAYRVLSAILDEVSRRAEPGSVVQVRTLPVFDILVKVGVVAGGIYFLFLSWEIDVTAWLASAGIIGIAIAFAARDSLANLFAGIFILADAPYKVGDFIVLDGGLRGEVTRIGIRSTRVLTRDDIEVTVPNSIIGGSKIVNEAGGRWPKQRVRVKVSCAYGSDIDQVREVLLSCAQDAANVSDEPEPRVRFRGFGDSGLEFELLAWIDDPVTRGRAVDLLNSRVYKAFGAAGIEIPYSKHDVYIKEAPPGLSSHRKLVDPGTPD